MIIYIWIYLPHGDTLENRAFISELQCIMDINVDLPALGGPSDDIEISSFSFEDSTHEGQMPFASNCTSHVWGVQLVQCTCGLAS